MAKNGNGRSDSGRQKKIDLMLKCLPSLKAFAISLTGNEVRAEDLVQQAVLQALTNLDSFQSGTNMSAWMFTILRNHFRSAWRKLRREEEWDDGFENVLHLSTGLGEGEAEATHDFRRLLLYLACLPVEQGDALIAVGYLGMSYEGAAEACDCAVGTVKSRVNRARTQLASLVEGSRVEQVDLAKLKTATRGVPQSHPYYPIAKAYEELYAASEGHTHGPSNGHNGSGNGHANPMPSESEKAWQELVASGALDNDIENLDVLIRGEQEEL